MRQRNFWNPLLMALAVLVPLQGHAAPVIDANHEGKLPWVVAFETASSTLVRAKDSPYGKCAPSKYWTSGRPTVELKVSEARQFLLKITSHRKFAAALVHPDGTVTCLRREPVAVKLAVGHYPLHVFLDVTGRNRLLLHIDRPGEQAEQVAKVRDGAPRLVPTGNGPNPLRRKVAPVLEGLRVSELGLSCAKKRGVTSVNYVGRVILPQGSWWRLTNLNNPKESNLVFLKNDQVPCVRGGADLDAGSYDIFLPAWVFQDTKEVVLAVEDLERPLWFGDAPVHTVGMLERPLWIPLESRRTENSPEVILSFTKPLRGIWVEVVTLGESKPRLLRLDRKPLSFGQYSDKVVAPGRVAVFAADNRDQAQRNTPRWLLLRRAAQDNTSRVSLLKQWGDPLARPQVKAGSLPLPHRELTYVYPYLPKAHPVDELFLRSPDLLSFVKRDSDVLKKGEPVMLVRYGKKRSTVVRATGQKVAVRTERLSTRPIAGMMEWSWTFAESPVPKKLRSLEDVLQAEYYLPLSARARFAAWRDKSMKIGKCISRFMKKHDPSYGKPYELIYVNSGRNVSDVVYRRARRRCGADKHDRAGERLIAEEIAREKKRRATLAGKLRRLIEKTMR